MLELLWDFSPLIGGALFFWALIWTWERDDKRDAREFAEMLLDLRYFEIHSPTGIGCTPQCRQPAHTRRTR